MTLNSSKILAFSLIALSIVSSCVIVTSGLENAQQLSSKQLKVSPIPVHQQSESSHLVKDDSTVSRDELGVIGDFQRASPKLLNNEKSNSDSALAQSDTLASEEYVQIKPEEITGSDSAKDLFESIVGHNSETRAQQSALDSEHKAADDELNAHLAQDSISSLESASRPYTQSLGDSRLGPKPSYQMQSPQAKQHAPISSYAPRAQASRPNRSPSAYQNPKLPASLVGMKGKLSQISQYPLSSPAHNLPRHLPRGAAAGYAAFRDFVRARASKYRQPQQEGQGSYQPTKSGSPVSSGYQSSYTPATGSAPPTAPVSYPAPAASPYPEPTPYSAPRPASQYQAMPTPMAAAPYPAQPAQISYPSAPMAPQYSVPEPNPKPVSSEYGSVAPPLYQAPASGNYQSQDYSGDSYQSPPGGYQAPPSGYQAPRSGYQPKKNSKVVVAQAYIPHIAPVDSDKSYGGADGGQSGYNSSASYANPILAKLYGGKSASSGKPEYSKDYGMIIHYPDASVYTEPMTIDQLNKLTGSGISSVLDQVQYNLAQGHRDEGNTIKSNNVHHIGHGITIQSKEYYAPDKNGQYVPTTAALISTGVKSMGSGYGQDSYRGLIDSQAGPAYGVHLGSGYDKVKQASTHGGNSKYSHSQMHPSENYGGNSAQSSRYKELMAISNMIGAELKALYKNQMPQHRPNNQRKPSHNDYPRSRGVHGGRSPHPRPHGGPSMGEHSRGARKGHKGGGYPGRPMNGHQMNRHPKPTYETSSLNYQQPKQQLKPYPAPQQHGSDYSSNGNQHSSKNDQALEAQMMQLLRDLRLGDEQYSGKNPTTTNQGYPHKIMQKYQKQAQDQAYNQHEGIEIPQGPNDQIGEISELIETLKGALGAYKSEPSSAQNHEQNAANNYKQQQHAKPEDIRYIASALGQGPTYSMQALPISGPQPQQDQSYGSKSEPASYQQQSQGGYEQPSQYGSYQQSRGPTQAAPAAMIGYQPGPTLDIQPIANAYQQQASQAAQPGPPMPPAAYGTQQLTSHHQVNPISTDTIQYAPAPPQQLQNDYEQPNYQPAAPEAPQGRNMQQPLEYSSTGRATGSNVMSGSYPSEQPQAPAAQPAQYQRPTTSIEHSTVINHLVPVVQAPSAAKTSDYLTNSDSKSGSSSNYQQPTQQSTPAIPLNQIAIAHPTESQYQQAQSLSSFVNSLPTEYQDLLRQPAAASIIDASSHPTVEQATGAGNSQDNYQAASSNFAVSSPVGQPSSSSSSSTGASSSSSSSGGSSVSASAPPSISRSQQGDRSEVEQQVKSFQSLSLKAQIAAASGSQHSSSGGHTQRS